MVKKIITKAEWERFQKIGKKYSDMYCEFSKRFSEACGCECWVDSTHTQLLDCISNPDINSYDKIEKELKYFDRTK